MAFNPYPSPESVDDERRKRARLRRSEATSSDSSDAGEFTIFNVHHRVAAPTPHPLPLSIEWDEQCGLIDRALGGATLANEARRILTIEQVLGVISVELVARFPYIGTNGAATGQPTVLIVARWLDEGCSTLWERAVRRIKKSVDLKRLQNGNLSNIDIAVEIIAEEHSRSKYISPISAELLARGRDKDWARIKDKVADIMDSYPATAGHVTSIQLFRLGFSIVDDENPDTVYVSVDYECLETKWPPIVGEVQQFLRQITYADLKLHMEHNIVEQCTFPLLPFRRSPDEVEVRAREMNLVPEFPYQTRVKLGADISASNYLMGSDANLYSPLVGTLGCWLEVKTTKYPKGVTVALTNFHIIRPAYDGFQIFVKDEGLPRVGRPKEDSQLWKADEKGIKPSANAPMIEHPSRSKHNIGVYTRQAMVDKLGESPSAASFKEKLDDTIAFFDNGRHVLGTVFCASGYKRRTANNGRLDWALVKPLDEARIGENKLPTIGPWAEKYNHRDFDLLPNSTTFGGLLQEPTDGLRGLAHGELVYKVGTTTRMTVGKFSHMKSDVKIAEDRHVSLGAEDRHVSPRVSEEFGFIQVGTIGKNYVGCREFATYGDSGSVVWDKEGRIVGLLFTGQTPQGTSSQTLSYITPIHDVFEDIMKFSNGEIKEIRLAPPPGN
ncbi:hypothetical protein B0T24DRAFT_638557 [Lasiosphaeria ovina]|uniref:Uncharacterized protein n=1 Tax=Lasiosphaeria ovina TaxID=92902 RepID=A0AAE0JVB2_9PEZI|nr:hypothetical protein B0T24DRAFT_638557 [Lasiosphaeria ovina]